MAEKGKTALVLGGGAIKGAFQAGALRYILGEHGLKPSFIYGISAGALNGAFIADRAGSAINTGKEPDWPAIGDQLCLLWEKKITRPPDILKRRFPLSVLLRIITKDFKGIFDPTALHDLIRNEVKAENLRRIEFCVGTVDVEAGTIRYVKSNVEKYGDIVEYVIASAQLPIAMPLYRVGKTDYYDGGIMDVAPIDTAIEADATEIYCVACQPREFIGPGGGIVQFDKGDVGKLAERVSDIVLSENLANDLKIAKMVNRMVEVMESAPGPWPEDLRRYKKITLWEIRPKHVLEVDILKFVTDDIKMMLKLGYDAAKEELTPKAVAKTAGS